MENEIALEETMPKEQETTEVSSDEVQDDENVEELQIAEKDAQVTVPVKYNKQLINLSIEQAGQLAQKGMKFDDMRTVMDKLAYLSAAKGQSADKFLDALVEQNENELEKRIKEIAGDDETLFSKLLELEHEKHKTAFNRVLQAQNERALKDEQDENERIAEQFIELSKEFPHLDNVKAVPQQVFEIAANNGISLLDGYLRYKHFEDTKVKAAQQDELNAAQSSVGSQRSSVVRKNDVQDAFVKGIWNRN